MKKRTLFSYFLSTFITFSIVLAFNNLFAQSKKESIELLGIKIDSFNNVVTKSIKMQDSLEVLLQNERNYSSKMISAKSGELLQLKQTITDLNNEMVRLTQQLGLAIDSLKLERSAKNKLLEQIESNRSQLQEFERLKEEMNKTNNSEVEYKSVKIGNVLWMTENLKVKTFSNGNPIPEANNKESWEAAVENGTPAWCYYDFNPANEDKYGILYNIYVFADVRGIGIDGWELPEKEDVFDMLIALGAKNVENGVESSEIAKKIIGKTSFKNYAGSNNNGLNLMPTGYASSQMFQSGEYFYGKDSYTGFWTALFGETKLEIGALTIDVCCGLTYPDFHPSSDGLPIRLIKTLK